MKRKLVLFAVVSALVLSLFSACSNQETTNGGDGISGSITVLTNRTDIVDTVFEEYANQFNEIYPDVEVNFESMADYEGQVKIRMNTKDYGDVLLIPNDVPVQELPDFFEPLGSVEELNEKYLFTEEKAFEGTSYGIPVTVNANGILYNKTVFEEAGVTDIPITPEEFISAMKKIKENTDAIPYYTNYKDGWPLTQWEPNRLSVAGEPGYVNIQMANMDDPFTEGRPHYILYKVLYDLAEQGLIEKDPTTTDWESSKQMIANGEIGSMVLGSWAIAQAQEIAANKDDIGYMPFPYNHAGKIYAASGGDYKIGINKNSENKEAARAWLDWFISESNFALDQGGISPVIGDPFPETLSSFEDLGVELISNEEPKEGQEGWVDAIDKEGEIGLWAPDFKSRIIEAGIGNRDESFDDIMSDLNEKWKAAREKVTTE